MWHGGVPTKLVVEGDPTVLVVDSIPTDLVVEGLPTRLVGMAYKPTSTVGSPSFLPEIQKLPILRHGKGNC